MIEPEDRDGKVADCRVMRSSVLSGEVDVAAYSSAATAFGDERDGQGGFATPAERIETL
ncbi:hypothetical protein [Paraburkholderia sp. GAS448]|uniref:hypothetical protein n=1 Tax=Paraburkholderia sp. GAS448 TaxID=3035136 RepID=UPI003D23C8C4